MQQLRIILMVIFLSTNLGCNIFEKFDEPEGDSQVLAAARACFDEGDYQCALQNYAKLTSATNDVKYSEEAFLIITRQGLGMSNFYSAFGQGGDGRSLTKLANGLIDPSPTKRGLFFEAYKKGDLISNRNLRGLVYFIASVAVAANVIAEGRGDGEFAYYPDLTAGSGCYQSSDCITDAACNAGIGITDTGTTVTFSSQTVSGMQSGPATLNHIKGALAAATEALNLLEVSGRFSSGSLAFANLISSLSLTAGVAAQERCFRYLLIDQGVGR